MNPTNESIGRPEMSATKYDCLGGIIERLIKIAYLADRVFVGDTEHAINREVDALKAYRDELQKESLARELDRQAQGEWVMVPRRLTAENGAKGLLSGELHETVRRTCDDCQGEGYDDDGVACEICNGECGFDEKVPVSWATIKRLHDMVVANLSAPQPPAQEQGEYPEAPMVCAEAYQVVGCLLDSLGLFDTPEGQKILDNLSQHRLVHTDILPWTLTRAAGAEDARGVTWPATIKEQGRYREVIQETLKWNGVPCFVTGRVWTHNNNWPLIDAAIASQADGEKP